MTHTTFLLFATTLLATPLFAAMPDAARQDSASVKRITSILYADQVEPCITFWVERMGFEPGPQVPDGDKIGFAIVQKGNVELMYQSYASAAKDANSDALKSHAKGASFLYIEVDDLDKTLAAMKGVEILVPVHATFYGMKEFVVNDPAGHVVIFAQPVRQTK